MTSPRPLINELVRTATRASRADGLLWVLFHLVPANAAEMADSTGLVSKCHLLIDLLGFRGYKEDPALI